MYNKIKSTSFVLFGLLLLTATGCKKGTFDINSPNPNTPSPESVPTKFILTAALDGSASLVEGGTNDFANYYMGYWAVSGDYIPNANLLQYNITASFFTGNWDAGYTLLKNYNNIILKSSDPLQANYAAIANIMSALHFQNLVDIYNNIPYSEALLGGANTIPAYDNGASVYDGLVSRLEAAVALIDANPDAEDPGAYDIMFGGDMGLWKKLANTIKLRILMRQTQTGTDIASKLSGLTSDDFLSAGEDAQINPGYSNAAANKQSPLWQDIGFTTSGTSYGNRDYNRANKYAVDFYNNLSDPRASLIYSENSSGEIKGRQFGSIESGNEHNTDISAPGGPGILTDAGMPATIMMATESLFLQAEAAQRGYLGESDAESLYQEAVTESFRFLGVDDYANAAASYTSQGSTKTDWEVASNKITLIITQKWAAMNTIDPLESWADWRRLGVPADLPISVYPGTTASHVPYRLVYPQTEYDYNNANVNSQGTIDPISSKIFWMP